ncbi:MAG: thermonuclease family protein [Rhizobiaceae bacterium]|nr:thermonuclease family protein [Rhizobiaceae bacterium]
MRLLALILAALSLLSPITPALAQSGAFPICSYGKRTQCVVDGDTFWRGGQKYRLKDIDAPEIAGGANCQQEYQTGVAATYMLQRLLESGIVSMTAFGRDRYGRTLVKVETRMGDVGSALMDARLARSYGHGRAPWC